MTPARTYPDRFWVFPSSHTTLPIDQVADYPLLEACLRVWEASRTDRLPSTIDPLDLPPKAIRGVSLMQWDEAAGDWAFRLSCTLIDDGHGRTMKGSTLADGFSADEVGKVRAQIEAVVAAGEPDLMRREYVDPQGRIWAFVRLLLPLSSDGVKRDGYVLVIDPDSFGRRIDQ